MGRQQSERKRKKNAEAQGVGRVSLRGSAADGVTSLRDEVDLQYGHELV